MAYNLRLKFEWDAAKNRTNKEKHGLSFDDAKELLTSDDDYLEIYDWEHSSEEHRFIAIGPISRGVIVVVYTERIDDIIRILSARPATKKEVQSFHLHLGGAYE